MRFNYPQEEQHNLNAQNTMNEIYNQPKIWREVFNLVNDLKQKINLFFDQFNKEEVKYILTGAGTSAFIGDSLEQHLLSEGLDVKAIATTDIVSNPQLYFNTNKKVVLVSFARSGNSPESLAAIKLAKEFIKDLYLINITCNGNGLLYTRYQDCPNSLTLLMPDGTNDVGFAMTSSYSSMLLTGLLLLSKNDWSSEINPLISNGEHVLDILFPEIQEIAQLDHDRVAFIGSNILKGAAREASLKVMELAAGKVATLYNSSLGLRHGPKFFVDNRSLVVFFLSKNSYTRLYDLDLLREIKSDNKAKTIVVLDAIIDESVKEFCDYYFSIVNPHMKEDILNGIIYVVFSQLFALFKSIYLGITPDNPSPTGEVNRVVKGVKIYEYKKEEK